MHFTFYHQTVGFVFGIFEVFVSVYTRAYEHSVAPMFWIFSRKFYKKSYQVHCAVKPCVLLKPLDWPKFLSKCYIDAWWTFCIEEDEHLEPHRWKYWWLSDLSYNFTFHWATWVIWFDRLIIHPFHLGKILTHVRQKILSAGRCINNLCLDSAHFWSTLPHNSHEISSRWDAFVGLPLHRWCSSDVSFMNIVRHDLHRKSSAFGSCFRRICWRRLPFVRRIQNIRQKNGIKIG